MVYKTLELIVKECLDTSFSVVICTRNRSQLLKKVFDSLNEQTYPHHLFEIVLVDNGSSDETPSVAAREQCQATSSVTYVVEKRIGLAYARNLGWKSSQMSVILYLDDDTVVARDCLENLANYYRLMWDGVTPIAIGGRVSLKLGEGVAFPRWLDEPSKRLVKSIRIRSLKPLLERSRATGGRILFIA